jgi:SAM-dependent methyltransferase
MPRFLAPAALILGVATGLAAWRGGWVVLAIRALDKRGGIASRRGEEAYAGIAPVFGGLHRVAAAEAGATLVPGSVVLDVGAGPGYLLTLIGDAAPGAERIGLEPSPTMRALASTRGITEIDGRAEALPLPDASVDLLVSTLSAHHWDDPVAAFREA